MSGFTGPSQTHGFSALVMNVYSTEAIRQHWTRLAKILDVDVETVLHKTHGRRSIDGIGLIKPEMANWEFVWKHEGALPAEFAEVTPLVPGVDALLHSLVDAKVPWAIVTSATVPLVEGWLKVKNMPRPIQLVTAEDVEHGKPAPDCFLLGAQKLGVGHVPKANIIVFEDAVHGIRAAKAAGFKVIAVTTTYPLHELQAEEPDWIVRDMSSITLKSWDASTGHGEIAIRDALVA